MVTAVGCVLVSLASAGCSSSSPASTPTTTSTVVAPSIPPAPATAAVADPSIPGIGATRHDWDATHAPNANFNNGMVYGDDDSLPSYLSNQGAVYFGVSDLGTGRIQVYYLNMHTVDRDGALAQVRQELPSDATVAWDLNLDQCYRVAFNSATLDAAGHYMAEVQIEDIQEGGSPAISPHRFNQASFQLDAAGSPPTPDIGC